MIVLSLFLFVLMIMIGGMAVDLMRYEYQRTGIQQTADRAALAAASLKQLSAPETVVKDYFAKAGHNAAYVSSRWTNPTLNSKQVWVDAKVDVETIFMPMMDIKALQSPANSGAEEAVSNIEISLVLDISGSMRENGMQITKLKTAAKEFFATVLNGDAKNFTSINIVPYAGQVNVGPSLFSAFGGLRVHGKSSCLELQAGDYTHAGAPAIGLKQTPHFMKWKLDTATMDWGWCPADKTSIRVAQNDELALGAFIDAMRLHDGTGTQTGVKYGLMLLNPDLRSTYTSLIAKGEASPTFAGRPMAWPTTPGAEVQKYMVVMTDGAIVEQARPKLTGIQPATNGKINNEDETYDYYDGKTTVKEPDPDEIVDKTDHDLLNATVETDRRPGSASEISPITTNVSRFLAECELAKSKGVVVYTIAFNTVGAAIDQMTKCATKPSYFFQVKDQQISSAFAVIARNIRQLKLIQ